MRRIATLLLLAACGAPAAPLHHRSAEPRVTMRRASPTFTIHSRSTGDETLGRVQGTVRAADGTPVLAITVIATGHDTSHRFTSSSDEHGGFLLSELPPGRYTLAFWRGEDELHREELEVRFGERFVVKLANLRAPGSGNGQRPR